MELEQDERPKNYQRGETRYVSMNEDTHKIIDSWSWVEEAASTGAFGWFLGNKPKSDGIVDAIHGHGHPSLLLMPSSSRQSFFPTEELSPRSIPGRNIKLAECLFSDFGEYAHTYPAHPS
jgi:hypothetical protein